MAIQPTLEGLPSLVAFRHFQRLIYQLDILGCQTALYEWVESYDSKDWDRLSRCVSTQLRVGLPLCLSHSIYADL